MKDNQQPTTINQPLTAKRGFALLYAVLVASLLLAIGLSIFNITIKELILSSSARDSEFAFFAADTGTDCALYWDYVGGAFGAESPAGSITCVGQTVPVSTEVDGEDSTHTFSLDLGADNAYCTEVTVEKTATSDGLFVGTSILSRGYNTCDAGNPRRVERAIRVTY
jgi:hypothetical protein